MCKVCLGPSESGYGKQKDILQKNQVSNSLVQIALFFETDFLEPLIEKLPRCGVIPKSWILSIDAPGQCCKIHFTPWVHEERDGIAGQIHQVTRGIDYTMYG